jgi:hypothetical protein
LNYYIDQEFTEYFRKPFFGKPYHTIELISIGIVNEYGDEYYAISKDVDPVFCNDWVQENVLKKIIEDFVNDLRIIDADSHNYILEKLDNKTIEQQFKIVQKYHGTHTNQIAKEILHFINPDLDFHANSYDKSEIADPSTEIHKYFKKHSIKEINGRYCAQPTFYGYFSDYDWVLFCSLFGTMMDLPSGFPMYCRDLKQMYDELESKMEVNLKLYKNYPKLISEHNALADAKFNKDLHEFLIKIQEPKTKLNYEQLASNRN